MPTLAEDRRALAQFFVTQASMRSDPWGGPLNPFAFAALWLHANTDRSVTTAYQGDYGVIYSLLRIIAERSNPYDAIAPRLLCYDYDNLLRDMMGDVNALMGSKRYTVEGYFPLALTAWQLNPGDPNPVWFVNQHSATHVADNAAGGKPTAIDGYNGFYLVNALNGPASYWDMLSAQVDDLRPLFKPVQWLGVDDSTDQGGAIGVGYRLDWTAPLNAMIDQGFYNCGTAEGRASGRAFYVNARRSRFDRIVSAYADGRSPMSQADVLTSVFGGSVTMV